MVDKPDLKLKIKSRIQHHGLVLYDGECGFCQFWIQFILDRDPTTHFLFAPLQAHWVSTLCQIDPTQSLDSILLYKNGVLFKKSTAGLQIAKKLRWPWNALWILSFIPRCVRDYFYDLIAAKRHRISMLQPCRILNQNERKRFLGHDEF